MEVVLKSVFFHKTNLYEIFYILLINEDVDRLVFMVSNYVQVGLETQMRTRKFRDQKH